MRSIWIKIPTYDAHHFIPISTCGRYLAGCILPHTHVVADMSINFSVITLFSSVETRRGGILLLQLCGWSCFSYTNRTPFILSGVFSGAIHINFQSGRVDDVSVPTHDIDFSPEPLNSRAHTHTHNDTSHGTCDARVVKLSDAMLLKIDYTK